MAPNTKDDEVNSEVIPKNEPQQEPIQHVETKKINEVIDLFEGRLL